MFVPSINALQLAVATRAKAFIASPVAQNVVNDLYSGNVVFSLNTKHSFLTDNYKPRAIQIYDVHKTHFLNHYRYSVLLLRSEVTLSPYSLPDSVFLVME
jgi:hypothetical protein